MSTEASESFKTSCWTGRSTERRTSGEDEVAKISDDVEEDAGTVVAESRWDG